MTIPDDVNTPSCFERNLPSSSYSIPFKVKLCRIRMSFSVMSLALRSKIQLMALKMFDISTFFWSFEGSFGKLSKVVGLPSILVEKRELARVDFLLKFCSISGGVVMELTTSLLASISARSLLIDGVKKYFGGINIMSCL